MDIDAERAVKIAKLNDRFRGMALDVMISAGVRDTLPDLVGLQVAIEQFSNFNENNDPYGEHDFGSLVWHGKKVFWKIDYYDQDRKYGLDPLDPKCRRVITVILASEY